MVIPRDQDDAPLDRGARPPAVLIASALLVLLTVLNVYIAYLAFTYEGPEGEGAGLFGWLSVAFASIFGVLAVFLYRGASWARYSVIGLTVLNLALAAVSWITSGTGPGCLTLLPQIILLILMYQRPVADWCYRH
jgi:hypothetical protein